MELGYCLTKICYLSLGTKTNATKQLRDTPKGIGEAPQGHEEGEGVLEDEDSRSQATPCARAS